MQLQEKVTERVKLHEQCKVIWDKAEAEKRQINAGERETLRKLNDQIDTLQKEIDEGASKLEQEREDRALLERFQNRERELAESRGRKTGTQRSDGGGEPEDEEVDLAFRGWALGKHASERMREAAERCGINIANPHLDMGVRIRTKNGVVTRSFGPVVVNRDLDIERWKPEQRALSVGTTTAGGNAVGNEAIRAYYEVQKWFAAFPESCLNVQTETGATLPWPTVTDTANTGRVLAEATTATTTTDPTFGVVNLGAFKLSSDAVLVSWELVQDISFDIAGYLGMALGRRIARIKNTKSTVGAGTTEPKGIIIAGTAGVTAASSTAFTMDEVIDLEYTVDKAYRNAPGASWMFHDVVAKTLRKFKDGQGRYLWEMSVQAGQPNVFDGFPILINNDMDSAFTTGKKLVGFGNWSPALGSYVCRNAGAVRFVRADELKVLEHQIVFEASQRYDSNLVDATAFKFLALA